MSNKMNVFVSLFYIMVSLMIVKKFNYSQISYLISFKDNVSFLINST